MTTSIHLPYPLKSVSGVRLNTELAVLLGTKDFRVMYRYQQIVIVNYG